MVGELTEATTQENRASQMVSGNVREWGASWVFQSG